MLHWWDKRIWIHLLQGPNLFSAMVTTTITASTCLWKTHSWDSSFLMWPPSCRSCPTTGGNRCVSGGRAESVSSHRLLTRLMSLSLSAYELDASVASGRFPPSARCRRRRRGALPDLRQLREDAALPGDRTSQTRGDALKWAPFTFAVLTPVPPLHRKPSQQWSGAPHCLASGPWPSVVPRGQRSTGGLTKALRTTWSSWERAWSALV